MILNYKRLEQAVLAYQPSRKGFDALQSAASSVGINVDRALVDAGFTKYVPSAKGVNASRFADKAPTLFPGRSEVMAALFLKLEQSNLEVAGKIASVWFQGVATEVPIHGKQDT